MATCVDCASGVSLGRWARIEQEAVSATLGRTVDFPFPDVCPSWDVGDLGDLFRAPVKTDVPVLFISGTLDCRTPSANVEVLQSEFADSEHVIVAGAGHDDLLVASSQAGTLIS